MNIGAIFVNGQGNDLYLRASPAHPTRQLHAADIGQRKIDHRNIGRAFANGLQARCPGTRLPDQFDLGHALQQRPNAGEHDRMIIDESDANGRHLSVSGASNGIWTKIVLPFPGADSTAIVPSRRATRSFMPDRPNPDA